MSKMTVSPSPHIVGGETTRRIMLDVIIALMPAVIASAVLFGYRALILIAATVASCVASEYISRKIMKRSNTVSDLSAVVTGILLALNLPVSLPIWMAVLGGAIAIVIVKQMFGGIGQNFANPAITARIVLMVSFASQMTKWTVPSLNFAEYDATASATPLAEPGTSYLDLFLGKTGGCIGETCCLALLIGGVYLVMRRVITPTVPLIFIGTVALLSWAFGDDPLYAVLSGGLMLGAIFMATDYATSPITEKGRAVFALCCGVLTALIRHFGSMAEGVSYSILLMNILTPQIDRLMITKPFGAVKKPKMEKGGAAK